jgi:hypothetical protein
MTVTLSSRPQVGEYAAYYDKYVATVPDGNVVDILRAQRDETVRLFGSIDEAKASHRYAAGKWSIAEVLGHVTDTERVFTYRAVTFARGDRTPLPSMDQEVWSAGSNASRRTLESLVEEYQAVRAATLALFGSFSDTEFAREGVASDNRVTVRGLAWITAGHERHHMKILRERYL